MSTGQNPAASLSTSSSSSTPMLSTSALLEVPNKRRLDYSVHRASSWSNGFSPDNILVDVPSDSNSRWSSDTNSPPQYLVLRLSRPAVLTSITFGKFEKSHVCNLKRFKVFGGLEDDENMMAELLDGGLKNDSSRETFRLRYHHTRTSSSSASSQSLFPCRFVRVVPLQCWGPSFNFSVWFVGLTGDDSDATVGPAMQWHKQYREKESIRLCLKHLRQRNFLDAFESLQSRTRVRLEDEALSSLYSTLVEKGDFQGAERKMEEFVQAGYLDSWMECQQPTARWTALITPEESVPSIASQEAEVEEQDRGQEDGQHAAVTPMEEEEGGGGAVEEEQGVQPPPLQQQHDEPAADPSPASPSCVAPPPPPQFPGCRGGHQMVIDSQEQVRQQRTPSSSNSFSETETFQTIYLFGGWDGHRDLADFWSYDIASNAWTLISPNTERDGGPSARSCHKMVLDVERKHVFVLGRYLERGHRDNPSAFRGDFFVFDLSARRWTLITDDTASLGGPALLFDHQMCLDQQARSIYVFGGLTLAPRPDPASGSTSERRYSGFFEYHIPTNAWRKRKDDSAASSQQQQQNAGEQQPGSYAAAASGLGGNDLRFRSSHSMLFHPVLRKLFVFGGQRKREDSTTDFFSYSVDSDEVEIISAGAVVSNAASASAPMPEAAASAVPSVGHTQRATMDAERNEIHVMTGLNKDKERPSSVDKPRPSSSDQIQSSQHQDPRVSNSFWVYSIGQNRWACLYRNSKSTVSPTPKSDFGDAMVSSATPRRGGGGPPRFSSPKCVPPSPNVTTPTEPRPRYAHQLVYDQVNMTHYMFGGNPGGREAKDDRTRLGDFWKLQLIRPTREEVLRRCRLRLRECRFKEMALSPRPEDKAEAIGFLQTDLAEVVDHQCPKEKAEFHLLASMIFALPPSTDDSSASSSSSSSSAIAQVGDLDSRHSLRSCLFDHLSSYFPEDMTHPRGNLIDLVAYPMDLS